MMDEPTQRRSLLIRLAVYRIRVEGRLEARWPAHLGGLTMTIHEAPGQPTITELTGSLPDQAALLGVLNQLYGRLVLLRSVECLSG